jgi:DnaJ-domain-containing protein 1
MPRISAAVNQNGSAPHFTLEQILNDKAAFADAYRSAARKLHPDTGGSQDAFVKLQQARTVLDQVHA